MSEYLLNFEHLLPFNKHIIFLTQVCSVSHWVRLILWHIYGWLSKMLNFEQGANTKFNFKLNKSAAKTHQMLWQNSHTSLLVQQFMAGKNLAAVLYPLYSPNLTPCNFGLFLKLKITKREVIWSHWHYRVLICTNGPCSSQRARKDND